MCIRTYTARKTQKTQNQTGCQSSRKERKKKRSASTPRRKSRPISNQLISTTTVGCATNQQPAATSFLRGRTQACFPQPATSTCHAEDSIILQPQHFSNQPTDHNDGKTSTEVKTKPTHNAIIKRYTMCHKRRVPFLHQNKAKQTPGETRASPEVTTPPSMPPRGVVRETAGIIRVL